MRAIIISIKEHESKVTAGLFYCVVFRASDGKCYRTHVSPDYRNYSRWRPIIEQGKVGVILDGLMVKGKGLIDADSMFTISPATDLDFGKKETIGGCSVET